MLVFIQLIIMLSLGAGAYFLFLLAYDNAKDSLFGLSLTLVFIGLLLFWSTIGVLSLQ